MAGLHSTQKENALNKCSKQDLILVTVLMLVALILKFSRNLFQTFNLDGLIIQISHDCSYITLKPFIVPWRVLNHPQNPASTSDLLFLSRKIVPAVGA